MTTETAAVAIIVAAIVYWRWRRPTNPLSDLGSVDRYAHARRDDGTPNDRR
jgi:hypothetical protein